MTTTQATTGDTANGYKILGIALLDHDGCYYVRLDNGAAPICVGWMTPTITAGQLDRTPTYDGLGGGADRFDNLRARR